LWLRACVAKVDHEAIHRFMTSLGWRACDWVAGTQGTAKGTGGDFPSDSHFQP
jgi:hypothetical protein